MGSKLKMKKPKSSMPPLAITNFTAQQLANTIGARKGMLDTWTKAREKEMFEGFMREFNEKLHRAENHAAFVNLLIMMYAVKMTWGFTKSQEKLISNLNPAREYIRRVGIRKAFDQIMKDCGTLLEFDDFDIEEEIKELEKRKA